MEDVDSSSNSLPLVNLALVPNAGSIPFLKTSDLFNCQIPMGNISA